MCFGTIYVCTSKYSIYTVGVLVGCVLITEGKKTRNNKYCDEQENGKFLPFWNNHSIYLSNVPWLPPSGVPAQPYQDSSSNNITMVFMEWILPP